MHISLKVCEKLIQRNDFSNQTNTSLENKLSLKQNIKNEHNQSNLMEHAELIISP